VIGRVKGVVINATLENIDRRAVNLISVLTVRWGGLPERVSVIANIAQMVVIPLKIEPCVKVARVVITQREGKLQVRENAPLVQRANIQHHNKKSVTFAKKERIQTKLQANSAPVVKQMANIPMKWAPLAANNARPMNLFRKVMHVANW
jgi:hypothetical protein